MFLFPSGESGLLLQLFRLKDPAHNRLLLAQAGLIVD
jgi:hypothetical protein